MQVVEERCVYCVNSDNSGWPEIRREAWVSSSLFGVSRAVQEFGLARFKSNVTKTMKGFEYILAKLQGESPGHCLGTKGPSLAAAGVILPQLDQCLGPIIALI